MLLSCLDLTKSSGRNAIQIKRQELHLAKLLPIGVAISCKEANLDAVKLKIGELASAELQLSKVYLKKVK